MLKKQKNQIKKLLMTIPYLSQHNRDYWINKMDSLNSSQLNKLLEILQNSQNDFDKAISESLNYKTSADTLNELSMFLNKKTRDSFDEVEKIDKEKEQKEIDNILNQL